MSLLANFSNHDNGDDENIPPKHTAKADVMDISADEVIPQVLAISGVGRSCIPPLQG